jgi:glycosyltransferase involved in cell wall biosynthesis
MNDDLHLRRLKCLQIAPAFAAFPTSGAELRSHHLAERLQRHMSVTHLAFAADHQIERSIRINPLHYVGVPRSRRYRISDLLKGVLGRTPFPVLSYTRTDMTHQLERLLAMEQFDFVQLESIHMAGYLPSLTRGRNKPRFVICDWHNIESELMERYSKQTSSVLRKLYAAQQSKKLCEFERWFLKQCDMHLVVSDRDRDALLAKGATVPVVVVENGVPVDDFADSALASAHSAYARSPGLAGPQCRRRVLFVGSMDYHPNIEAVLAFAEHVWPSVASRLPDAVFTVVGRNPPEAVRGLSSRVRIEVTGSVTDVRPYYYEAFAAVVPLRVAGGTRLKILEAMAAGVPVISTGIGAEGLCATPDVHFIQADTAAATVSAILAVAAGGERIQEMIHLSRDLTRRRYDWGVIGDALASHYSSLVNTPHG